MTLKIGLTGGIGAGKTTVARIFEILGVPVFYADPEAKKLIENNFSLRNQIISEFGEKAYIGSKYNTSYIAGIVFNEKKMLHKLNDIVHPFVHKAFTSWFDSMQMHPYVMEESALLFETGVYSFFDKTVIVTAPEDIRSERIARRDNKTTAQIEKRIKAQKKERYLIKYADFVIVNSERNLIIPQVLELHKIFVSLHG